MDMLNKLKSTVSTTVSQLSGVLPGNPVTREYEIEKHIGSAGQGLLWKIYNGYKKSTKQEAAIFVLEKKVLDNYPKRDRDYILDVFRKGVAQLTRLRHPQVLTVQHPLEESRESLAFATEPVFASLANVLGQHDNLPIPIPSHLKDHQLYDVEKKYGLQQLTEGLIFLHNDGHLLHGNVCPESIIINQQGAWKIFGFDFCTTNQNSMERNVWCVKELDPDLSPICQPNLDYLAPELGLGKRFGGNVNTVACSSATDMYSLGCTIMAIYQKGESPWKFGGNVERFFKHAGLNPTVYNFDGVPSDLVDHVRGLLCCSPDQRLDAHQFVKIPFFEDIGVKTLNYLDSLFQWDNLQKSQFYKGLPQILPKLPHRVCLYRIMPCLAKEFVNPSMVPFVLPCAMFIAQDATKESFVSSILPYLKPVMKIQDPIQVLLIFMQRMELLLQKTPPDDVKSDVLPMVYRALETEASTQIQELCLSVIPNFASLVDYPAMKNALLPRIKKLCLSSNQLSVRVNCLLTIGKLLDNVDKWLVLDDILPMLQKIPSRDPATIMGILGIYKIAFEHPRLGIPKEVVATQILPFLFPLSVEPSLSIGQFRALMAVINEMIRRVEEEQKVKLENVAALQEEQRSALQFALDSNTAQVEKSSMTSSSSKVDSFPASFSSSSVIEPQTQTKRAESLNTNLWSSGSHTNAMPAKIATAPMGFQPSPTPAVPLLLPTGNTDMSPRSAVPSSLGFNNKKPLNDAVSSMMESNLSAMKSITLTSPVRPASQWPTSFQGNTNIRTPLIPQQTVMSRPPSFPYIQQGQYPHTLPISAPLLPSQSAIPVRPLAMDDINDLLR